MNNESTPTSSESDLSVLLIDDDTELCELVQEFFTARGIRRRRLFMTAGAVWPRRSTGFTT